MAQTVPPKVLMAEPGYNLVPVRRVAQDGRGDPAAARAREDAGRRVVANRIEAPFDQRADLFNERDKLGTFALCALVDETAWAWCGLPPNRPGPRIAIDVRAPDTGLRHPAR